MPSPSSWQAGIIWLGTWSFFKLQNMGDVSLLPKQINNLSRTCKIKDGPKLLYHWPNNIFCQGPFNLSRRLINTKNFAHLIWIKCYGTVGVVDRWWMCGGYAWGGCEWEYLTGYWCFSKSWKKFVEGLLNSEFICPWYVALLFCSKSMFKCFFKVSGAESKEPVDFVSDLLNGMILTKMLLSVFLVKWSYYSSELFMRPEIIVE